jgi:hypothetical protein
VPVDFRPSSVRASKHCDCPSEPLVICRHASDSDHSALQVTGKACPSESLLRIVSSDAWAVCFAWGCSFLFCSTPSGFLHHMPDYRLTALMDVDVLDSDLLLAASSVALKSLHLGGERSCKLV